jgi:hypothetical protein
MDQARMAEVLQDCLAQVVEGQDPPDGVEIVDCYMPVPIKKQKAEEHREELVRLLKDWPDEAWGAEVPALEDGPSYIQVGGVIGSQQLAFLLFAVGKVLGFWDIITPKTMGIEGEEAASLVGSGMVMISGYDPN